MVNNGNVVEINYVASTLDSTFLWSVQLTISRMSVCHLSRIKIHIANLECIKGKK